MAENYLLERQPFGSDVPLSPVHIGILEVDVIGLSPYPSYPENTSYDRAQSMPTE